MPESSPQKRAQVRDALRTFHSVPIAIAGLGLLSALGYTSSKTADLGTEPEDFLGQIEQLTPDVGPINREKIRSDRWKSCAFLFQLTNDEIPSLASGQQLLPGSGTLARSLIESFVFLAIDLQGENWSRGDLAIITREINRRFPMPAIVLFRHGPMMSLALIHRRANLRDSRRDVLERVTIVKDVRLSEPLRAHIDILAGIAIENLGGRQRPGNFGELYDAWMAALSIQELNRKFYTQLAYWYFWAVRQVEFPLGGGTDPVKRNSVAVIRLLTRLIFVWFIKEKGLVPEALFDRVALREILKTEPTKHSEESNYYLAVLQNLFFATLNVEMGPERKWAADGAGMKADRLIHTLYRHREMFRHPDKVLDDFFSQIPFLNGGLFECLDRELTDRDIRRNPKLKEGAAKEGTGWVLRVDGFSRRKDAQPKVPNKLFFGGEESVDLNDDLGTSGKSYDVEGLIDIFSRFKFTVDENTPVEEEVALDPELLGKVFENLLASYNEDTQATARKQSGSFYTPREVVDYMVDETLLDYFGHALRAKSHSSLEQPVSKGSRSKLFTEPLDLGTPPGELELPRCSDANRTGQGQRKLVSPDSETRLRELLSYGSGEQHFSSAETAKLIAAIERLKLIDPACGSGAFPMGALLKLVHVLKKLDPDNALWRAQNRRPLQAQLTEAKKIPDPNLRESKVEDAEAALAKFDRDFGVASHADYTRKLYLIEKCIHGVDIQPIGVQIAKLRFFIALIVSQEVDRNRDNWGITALPNLETKIVAADALIPIERPEQMGLRDPAVSVKEKELVVANESYFAARTGKTKRKWRERIFDLRDELAGLLEQDRFVPRGSAQQLVQWNPFDQNAAADFFDPEWMFQITDGFDIVIGNPPYVRQEKIPHLKERFKELYDCYTGTADLYVYFYERSIRLLKPGGAFAFITSNKWYRAAYGEKLRDWMNRHTRLRIIIDFGDEAVFTSIAYPTIVVATRRDVPVRQATPHDVLRAFNWPGNHPVETFPVIFSTQSFDVPQIELKKDGWQIETPLKRRVLATLRSRGISLREFASSRVYRGITTGLNRAFVISGEERAQLIADDPKSVEVIKPFLQGRELDRWGAPSQDQWLIFTRRGIPIRQYPAILSHLKKFKKELMPKPADWDETHDGKRWSGRKAGNYQWYEIQDNIAYWREFDSPKVVSTKVSLRPTFFIDERGLYLGNTSYFLPVRGESSRYLLALLNSTVSEFYARQVFVGKQNGYYEVQPDGLEAFPVPPLNARQNAIMNRTDFASLAVSDPRFEQLINGLVYELFFPDELHARGHRIFEEAEKAGLLRLSSLKGKSLKTAAEEFLQRAFSTAHPLYAMLFDLQALDVVRIIEGRA